MDAGINNVIYMELNSGPKIANNTCGKTIVAGMIDRGSTVICSHYVQLEVTSSCDQNACIKACNKQRAWQIGSWRIVRAPVLPYFSIDNARYLYKKGLNS